MRYKLHTYQEHQNAALHKEECGFSAPSYYCFFKKEHRGRDSSLPCFEITENNEQYDVETNYFIGVDWIIKDESAIHISPKLNDQNQEVDFIKMLFSCLKHPDVSSEINELFEVKWEEPTISITQQQDLLTPFLVVEFLSVLKTIVRKGLKKSYYRVERNLNSRVKGKVLISKTIKNNLIKSKSLSTYCSYEEYGYDNTENRLLKKALEFVKRYLPNYSQLINHRELVDTFNFINPAFDRISDDINLLSIKSVKTNSFYKEYAPALKLAKMILRRFGYNISNTKNKVIRTPPFWIDMTKLFELYTLGLLKDRFQKSVEFQFKHYGNELDYLLNSEEYKMVIDAKYKSAYLTGEVDDDIRQVSGYARLKRVYEKLGIEKGKVIDCLIIHPDQEHGVSNLKNIDLKRKPLRDYYDVYKIGVKLPITN